MVKDLTMETSQFVWKQQPHLFLVQIWTPLISISSPPPLKEYLRKTKFSNDDEVKSTMNNLLKYSSKIFMQNEYKSLFFKGKICFKECRLY